MFPAPELATNDLGRRLGGGGCVAGVDYCVLWPLASRGEIITNIGFIADTRGVTGEWELNTHGVGILE